MKRSRTERKSKKQKYPFIAFRPTSQLQEQQIRRVAKQTGMSISEVVLKCISVHLPELEKTLTTA